MEHAAEAPAWAVALEASALGLFMRQSIVAYPVANLTHLLGLVLLIGPIALLDLRVLGLGRARIAADVASGLLTPFAVTGLTLSLASGALLFAADAGPLAGSTLVLWKLTLVAAGVVNALLFRALWRRRLAGWDARPAAFGRAQAAASLALWLVIAALGRLIAYL